MLTIFFFPYFGLFCLGICQLFRLSLEMPWMYFGRSKIYLVSFIKISGGMKVVHSSCCANDVEICIIL